MHRAKRVLIVERDPKTSSLLQVALRDHVVSVVPSRRGALELIEDSLFDLYIIARGLRDGRGGDLCARVRRFDPNTPIIITGKERREKPRERMGEGARVPGGYRFLAQPLVIEHVARTARNLLEESELRSYAAEIDEIAAVHDQLDSYVRDRSTSLNQAARCTAAAADRIKEAAARIQQARARLALVHEKVLLIRGYQTFLAAGGSPAQFEDRWPEVLGRI